ncbi:MAG: ATP-binding protein [Planctomycetota bacterium]
MIDWSAELIGVLLIGAAIGGFASAMIARTLHVRDVRRVREAEARARGAERLAELGSMTGGLAHEIKNPLSTVGLNAQLLAEGIEDLAADAEDTARLLRRVDTMRREVDRLRGILEDFMAYAGELRLEPKPGDLNAAVAELVDFFMPQAEQRGVRLRADLATGELSASFDADHTKQALLNLMLNAVQAMAAAGDGRPMELIVRTRAGRSEGGQATAEVSVADTGPGLDEATLARVFDPYFTTKPGGTGLGLPTTRRIVEGQGGRVIIHTESGRGTEVTLQLPATD